jgi:hypothetical protein
VARSSSLEPTPATAVESDAGLREDPEKTLVMEPGAASAAGEEPDEPSIDCSSFDSITPEPAAKDSPVAQVDSKSDHSDDAPIAPRRSRRLLAGAGLAGSALMIALAIAAIPGTVPQVPAAPPELGAGALVEPSLAIAASPSVDTASARRNAPASTAKAPGSTQRAAGKSPFVKTPWSAKAVKKPNDSKQATGSQSPPSQGAAAPPPVSLVPAPQDGSTSSPPSTVFGGPR